MKLLLLYTREDESYLERFQRLPALVGHKVVKTSAPQINPVTLDVLCKKHEIDAVICTQQLALHAILKDTVDWIAPGKKQVTLDDYAGSLLRLRSGREVVVCNPLARLFTVAHEKWVLNRYVSKLTQKHKWFPQTAFTWELVRHETQEQILAEIEAAHLVAIDIENPFPQNDLRTISCVSYTCYDKVRHTTRSFVVEFDELWHWEFIKAANASAPLKVFQNGLHDNSYFMRWACPVNNWCLDTFHLFHSWLSELPKRLDFITALCIRDVRFWKDESSSGSLTDFHRYNAKDGWATINALFGILHECPDFAISNYVDHEFLMVFPSLHASMEGLECDVERFEKIAAEKEAEVIRGRTRIQYLLSEPNFNPGSPPQVVNLFHLLGCAVKDRDGKIGTGKIPMQRAMYAHPLNGFLLEQIIEYRKDAKQFNTYFDSDKLWHGRILYSFNPGGTDTLRASSSESSFDCGWQIQNIPNTDDSFKQCCLAPQGWYIAEVDKKQSEARCVGYLSGDTNLLNLVESEYDYHAWNASKFFGVAYELIFDMATGKTIDKKLRDLSKRTNHGANYNMGDAVMLDTMGPKKVAEAKITLKLPRVFSLKAVCGYLLARYNATYPSVKGRWYESIIQQIEATGKLVSPLGWVRVFHGSPRENKLVLNSAVAHAPQNLSVSVVNKEWYKIWRLTVYGELRRKVRIKAQIHDSLLFIYRNVVDALRVKELMDTRVTVVGSDNVTRVMFIPSDLSVGDSPTRRWSEIK